MEKGGVSMIGQDFKIGLEVWLDKEQGRPPRQVPIASRASVIDALRNFRVPKCILAGYGLEKHFSTTPLRSLEPSETLFFALLL